MVNPRRRLRWFLATTVVVAALATLWFLSLDGGPTDDGRRDTSADAAGGESPAITWTRTVTVDSGAGRVGPWRMNRSDWRYVDDPTVALDGRGRAAVAWVDQARKDVLFQRYGPGGAPLLAEPANVSRSPGVFSWLPRVAVAPGDPDRTYVLWQEIVFSGGTHGGEAFFARSADGGRTFGEPVNLSRTEAGAGKGRLTPEVWHNGSLDLAVGPGGTVYAAWTVYEGGLFLARSTDRGDSFSDPLRVTSAGGGDEPARGPSVAVGSEGTVHLAWAVGGDPEADLRYALSRDTGRSFAEPRRLFSGPGHADAPKLALGDDGTLHLAWAVSPEGPGRRYGVRHARGRIDSAGTGPDFGEPRTVSRAPEGSEAGARFPHLAPDASGDPWIAWERYPPGRRRSRGLALATSPDGGRSFSSPSPVPGTAAPAFRANGSLQGLLMRKLAVGADGTVAVVNSAFEPEEASRVRLYLGRTDPR